MILSAQFTFKMQSVAHWKRFFSEHKSYFKVGRVNHPLIDTASPLPTHCEPKEEAEQKARYGTSPLVVQDWEERVREVEEGNAAGL